mmetsp:Transcript_4529/g.8242  ORF Transcript_4529/g.8242 Transcript_4529/m.8242 type:complete len:335 (-) Transcript_4529:117-1121(-)|eukprot:CAMPEP_0197525418 /NCGR_PEP_ID=MMETSP1318-20131121/11909_1 /TAXON_ID=552666 /ORGANISM="Partenskyella glossopodia, Strain RCC365" /LENGTH=334 /DNA_ID=CAMNT_0043078805 /DNA_START=73 /DNA_END=1077 /DNA_ORIENTATION=-
MVESADAASKKDKLKGSIADKYDKWKEDNKEADCSNGYLCNIMGHHFHITEVLPLLFTAIAVLMGLFLMSGTADIQSVVFCGMAMGVSGLALVAFWNYKDVLATRTQADLLESLVKAFDAQIETFDQNNSNLEKEIAELRKNNKALKGEAKELEEELGIVDSTGKDITKVLDGYESLFKIKKKLNVYTQTRLEAEEELTELDAELLVSETSNRIKRELRVLYLDYRDYDEEEEDFTEYITVSKTGGKYDNEVMAEFIVKIKRFLKKQPALYKKISATFDILDADGDGKLSSWEFMLEMDKCIDEWAKVKTKQLVDEKCEELKKEQGDSKEQKLS